jgi:hypothetical protein
MEDIMTQVIEYTGGFLVIGGRSSEAIAAFVTNPMSGNVGVATSAQGGWTWSQVGATVAAGGVSISGGVGAVSYPATNPFTHFPAAQIYTFAVGQDQKLYVGNAEGSFHPAAASAPASIPSGQTPEAVTIGGASAASQQIYAFAYDGAGDLQAYSTLNSGSTWQWTKMGLPPHATPGVNPGPKAVAIAPGWVSLFAVINGKLWQCGLNGGAAEAWFEIPKPPTDFATVLGVISPTYPPPEPLHGFLPAIYVFLQDATGNVWIAFWRDAGLPSSPGNFWQWIKLPPPQSFGFMSTPLQYGTLCPPQSQKAYVFLVGVDAKVYMAFGDLTSLVSGSSGAGDWQWKSLGAFISHVTNSPVITYPIGTAQNGTGQPVVFLQTSPDTGADELYSCTWTGSAGLWADLGAPPN